MSETTSPEIMPRPRPEPRRRWRPRALHWHLSIWSLVTVLLVSLFLVLASMSLTGRVIALPDWVAVRLLERMNAALPTGSFTLRGVEFGVTPRGRPKLRLVDVGIKDATGLEIAQLNGVEGGFHLGAALMGRIEPTVLRLQGAQVTLRRFADGSFALSLGQDVGTAGNLAAVLDRIDALFTGGPLATAGRLEATDLTITLEDARSGRLWQVTDGRLEIVPAEQVIDTVVRFDVFNQTEELASTEFSFRSSRASSEASIAARFENAAAADIAAQTPALAFLSVFDAPISGALRSSVDAEGAVSELVGTLSIGAGALSPAGGAQPAQFDGARIYIDYDPATQRIDFQGASVQSELGRAEADGHVFLTDFRGGWPNSLIAQISLNGAQLNPVDLLAAPLDIDSGRADLRVRLAPFSIDIGQAVMFRGDHRYEVSGSLGATPEGWKLALDGAFEAAELAEVMALWPLTAAGRSRQWVAEHVSAGEIFDGSLVWRKAPGAAAQLNGTFGIRGARFTFLDGVPPVELGLGYMTMGPQSFTVAAEEARITAPDGSAMDLAGTSYRVPDLKAEVSTGTVNLAMDGPLRGALSILSLEPFSIFRGSRLGPDMARGTVSARGLVTFPIRHAGEPVSDVRYDIRARLADVSSDVLVEGKLFAAAALELEASEERIAITGPVRIGQAEASGTWTMPLVGGRGGGSTAEGTLEINARSLTEFGLDAVAEMVSGSARGRFSLALGAEGPPRFELRSDLAGLGLAIPGTGWQKAAAASGALELTARLGARPVIDAVSLTAPGFSATGKATTAEGGGLGEARFERVSIGGWLNAPVVLTGRGPGQPIAIAVPGGTIDMRRAQLDTGGGGRGRAGPRQPLTLALETLIVSEGIRINNLRADLDLSGGLSGSFSGRVDGGGRVTGTIAQTDQGAAFRIVSGNAGDVLRGAGVFQTARGGDLELILAPVAGAGTYEGEFTIENTRLVQAPAMAELLSAVSVVGLLEQLEGQGIHFSEVEGRFRLTPKGVTLYRSAAIGASMGISLDGYFDMEKDRIDMQGVLSPLYILNSVGRIFSPRDGEGLVGFNFTLKGDVDGPEVQINPLSILTPGVFREIFRRPPPEVPKD